MNNVDNFNVIKYDTNSKSFKSWDVIPYLKSVYEKAEKKPVTFNEYRDMVKNEARYKWWSRCEYEIILSDWPSKKHEEKWDIYRQITMNLNVVTNILMNVVNGDK